MSQKLPFFSIIIPTVNRPIQLTHCLQSLACLDYPRERFEVIVVDDGGETLAETVVSSFYNRLNITLINQRHSGPAMARNKGATHAKGDFLAFTDDDCTPAADWLKTLVASFDRTSDNMIGGRTLNLLSDSLYSTASHLLIDYLYSYYNPNPDRARFFTSNNLTIPADHFRAIGGFNTLFPHAAGEDREFCERWLSSGCQMTYAPEVLVYHTHRLTFASYCRQHFNYGRGAFRFRQMCSRLNRQRLRLEPLSFYLNMLRYPLSQMQGKKALLFLTLLFLSQGANGTGFLWEMGKQIIKKDHQAYPSRRYD